MSFLTLNSGMINMKDFLVSASYAALYHTRAYRYLLRRFSSYPMILLYHSVDDFQNPLMERRYFFDTLDLSRGKSSNISPEVFRQHIRFLKRHFEILPLETIVANLKKGRIVANACAVTFDDAYKSLLEHAVDFMETERVPATVFVNSDLADGQHLKKPDIITYVFNKASLDPVSQVASRLLKEEDMSEFRSLSKNHEKLHFLKDLLFHRPYDENLETAFTDALLTRTGLSEKRLASVSKLYMTWEDLRSLNHELFSIGNHGKTHRNLSTLGAAALASEIDVSREEIVKNIYPDEVTDRGRESLGFAIPFGASGDVSQTGLELIKRYHSYVLWAQGGLNQPSQDPYALNRCPVLSSDRIPDLLRTLYPPRILWDFNRD